MLRQSFFHSYYQKIFYKKRSIWRRLVSTTQHYLLLVLATLAPVACTTNSPITDTFTGTVTKVHDGDSIHITPKGEKRVIIRLAGIDAPEIKQPFGIASRDKLRSMILNRRAEAKCHKTDRYQRQICVVYFNGDDVNLQMVRSGMAWHYKDCLLYTSDAADE